MYQMEFLLVSALVAFAHGTNWSKLSKWNSSWIVGGTSKGFAHFPYMVSLRSPNLFICGGTIIDNRHVLTAAHCVYGRRPSLVTVVAGTKRANNYMNGQSYGVDSFIIHHAYNPLNDKNDIAILKLSTPIAFNHEVQAVTLANQDEETAPGSKCLFMGWGITSLSSTRGPLSYHMIVLKVLSMLECMQSYLYVSITYICADAGPGKGTSKGDAGGPLVCNGKQVGVYSGGGTPGSRITTPYASLFISVAKFRDWIQENTV